MRESTIERYLCEQVKKHGGLCEKFKSGKRGVPDRLVSWPEKSSGIHQKASVHFVELKTCNGVLSRAQASDLRRRQAMGLSAWIIRSKTDVDFFVARTR